MRHPILAEGLQSRDGRSLTYADNQHLFRWPGALVYGGLEGISSDSQQVFEDPMDVDDWGRTKWVQSGTTAGYPERPDPDGDMMPSYDAPDETPAVIRDRLQIGGRPEREKDQTPDDPQFARGNAAAAFEARRNRDRWMALGRDIRNPVLEKLKIQTLLADFPNGYTPTEYQDGALWVLDALAADWFNQPIIPPDVCYALGAFSAGQLLATYLTGEHSEEIVTRFKETIWESLQKRIEDKLEQVRGEIFTWARAGSLPVSKPRGGTDECLTLVNAIAATTEIYHLAKLGKALQDFEQSGSLAIMGVLKGVTSSRR